MRSRALITGFDRKGNKKRARGLPPGFLNKQASYIDDWIYGLNEATDLDIPEDGDSELLMLIEQDLRAKGEGKEEDRVWVFREVLSGPRLSNGNSI